MQVKATPGTRCPKEGKPREYITDNIPEAAPDSAYYRRLISDGSLLIVPDAGPENKDKGGKK